MKTIEKTRENFTIIFYKKEGDKKYSFIIKNKEGVEIDIFFKTKRISEKKLHFAENAIFEKLLNLEQLPVKSVQLPFKSVQSPELKIMENKNPIVKLAEAVQKLHGANIETRVISKTGPDHCPVITCEIILPDGEVFRASACNKKEAKQTAAQEALLHLDL